MPRDLGMFDEGIVLSDAMLVLHGEIVHRDFYSIYGPAQYYVIAALFKLFGKDFIIARLYDLAVRAAIVAMLFYLLGRQCSLLIALVFSAIGGMWLLGIGFYLYPIFPCILLSLISSYVVTSVAEKPVSPAIVGAGACTGLIALFRYDAGFFLLIAHLFSIAVLIALSGHGRTRIRLVLTAAVTYAAGTAIVFVPVAIVFLIFSPIEAFFADIIECEILCSHAGVTFSGPPLHRCGSCLSAPSSRGIGVVGGDLASGAAFQIRSIAARPRSRRGFPDRFWHYCRHALSKRRGARVGSPHAAGNRARSRRLSHSR